MDGHRVCVLFWIEDLAGRSSAVASKSWGHCALVKVIIQSHLDGDDVVNT